MGHFFNFRNSCRGPPVVGEMPTKTHNSHTHSHTHPYTHILTHTLMHTRTHILTHTLTLTHTTCSFSPGGQAFIQAAVWQPWRKEEGWGRGHGKQRRMVGGRVGGGVGGCCLVPWRASVPLECEEGSKGPRPTGFFKNSERVAAFRWIRPFSSSV